jgi:hypothetical protein
LVGLLWTSDRPIAKASTVSGQHGKAMTNIRALSGIRTHDPSVQAIKVYASERAATGTGCLVFQAFISTDSFNWIVTQVHIILFKP